MLKYVFDKCCHYMGSPFIYFYVGYLNLFGPVVLSIQLTASPEGILDIAIRTVEIITLLFGVGLMIVAIAKFGTLHKRQQRLVMWYSFYYDIFLVMSFILIIVNLARGPYDISIIVGRSTALMLCSDFISRIRSSFDETLATGVGPPDTS